MEIISHIVYFYELLPIGLKLITNLLRFEFCNLGKCVATLKLLSQVKVSDSRENLVIGQVPAERAVKIRNFR